MLSRKFSFDAVLAIVPPAESRLIYNFCEDIKGVLPKDISNIEIICVKHGLPGS